MAIDIPNILLSFLVGTVGAGIAAAVINQRFAAALDIWRSQRGWKERAVTELLGPIYILLDRTKRAFDRWDKKDLFLEGEIVKNSNLAIRDLLLSKPYLIPPSLRNDASELILHYAVWLEEFDRLRRKQTNSKAESAFVFTGPLGYPFPSSADKNFRETFELYWRSLYANQQ
jgi:hypothetical protein